MVSLVHTKIKEGSYMNEQTAVAYEQMKCAQEQEQANRKAMVEITLDRLGIPRQKEGYKMLEEIILYVCTAPDGLKAFKKKVFPAVFPGVSSKQIYDECTEAMLFITKSSNRWAKRTYAEIFGEELSADNFPTVKKFVENMYSYLCEEP